MGYVERFADMSEKKERRFEVVNGQLFTRKGPSISPFGPASQVYDLDAQQCHTLLEKLGGLWVSWTTGFEAPNPASEWYAVVCKKHASVEDVASQNTRSKLRRGLKRCDVKRVSPADIAKHGYETYCEAIKGYSNTTQALPTQDEFARRVMSDEPFGDIRDQWAVYHEGKMVAFAQNLIYDKTEVDYTLIKLHPGYLNRYSSYALIYRMNEYYLAQEGFEYVNDGTRSISHETGIQEFLMKEFGFEKAYMNLHVYYRPPLGIALKMARPFRKLLSKVSPKLAAVMELDRVAVNR